MTSSSNGSEPKSIRHKTLSAYYPYVYNLLDLIKANLSTETCIQRPNDPEEFEELLSGTICTSLTTLEFSIQSDLTYKGTQQEAISRIVQALGDSRYGGAKNVLLFRERSLPDPPVTLANGRPIQVQFANTAFLRSLPWRILRSRIGDQLFQQILLQVSLFTQLENNCLIQISGFPIHDLNERSRPEVPNSVLGKRARRSDPAEGRRRRRVRQRLGSGFDALDGKNKRQSSAEECPASRCIARHIMFYGQPLRRKDGKILHGLHPKHILNYSVELAESGSEDKALDVLTRDVFPHLAKCRADAPETSNAGLRFSQIQGVLKEMIARHRAADYGRVVRRFVALARDTTGDDELQPVSHSVVGRCICTIFKSIVSPAMAGSEHNLQILIQKSRRLIEAKHFEPLSLHYIMQGLRIEDVAWLKVCVGKSNRDDAIKRRQIFEDFVFWLFNSFLVPLIRNSFYVTETAETRYQTVYYDHDDWRRHTKPHMKELQQTLLKPLTMYEKRTAIQNPLGISAVRLVPKPRGFRPIVNLGRRIISTSAALAKGKKQTANELLTDLHHVLTVEKNRDPETLGSSLLGTSEIFSPLATLKSDLVRKHGKIPRLYFVKMDIKAAFDTIDQDRMLEIVSNLLDQDYDYCLVMYSLLLPPASKASSKMSRKLFKVRAALDDGSASFSTVAEGIIKPLRNAVMVDLARRRQVTREACMALLRLHLKSNVWELGGQLFRQSRGIPQGSKLSSLLCSLCYAALEKQYLSYVHQPGSRLLRYIDDFLFISDDYHLARRFVSTMSKGFPEYGAFVSPGKTLVNFECALGNATAPVCPIDASGSAHFPYCGFSIDTKTLGLSMDYVRVLAGPVEQSFALRFTRRKGSSFVGWFSRQLENRNHVAYLDTTHNDLQTVCFNIYLNFAMTAMKIPYYFGQALAPAQSRKVFESICLAVDYTYVAGRGRVQHLNRAECTDHYGVKKRHFVYLAKSAVLAVLAQKISLFKDVVHLLKADLSGREYRALAHRFESVNQRAALALKAARY